MSFFTGIYRILLLFLKKYNLETFHKSVLLQHASFHSSRYIELLHWKFNIGEIAISFRKENCAKYDTEKVKYQLLTTEFFLFIWLSIIGRAIFILFRKPSAQCRLSISNLDSWCMILRLFTWFCISGSIFAVIANHFLFLYLFLFCFFKSFFRNEFFVKNNLFEIAVISFRTVYGQFRGK